MLIECQLIPIHMYENNVLGEFTICYSLYLCLVNNEIGLAWLEQVLGHHTKVNAWSS